MAEQSRVSKSKSEAKRVEELEKATVTEKTDEQKKKEEEELDALLASIDEALGDDLLQNSEQFIRDFVQKGGQLCETLWYNVREGFRQTVLHLLPGGYNGNMRGGWLQ